MTLLHITTERLVLKPHTQNSLVWLNTTFNNPEEDYFNGDDPPRESLEPLEVTQKLLDRILNRPPDADIIDYAIHKRGTDELIGCGMIAHINHYNRRCDLGIRLGWNRDNWGKGYASETLQAIVAYCFNELDLNRIGAEIYEFNERSIRLFERNGFRREGVFRQYIFKDGIFKDEHLYSLVRGDWEKRADVDR
ncbi:MAG: GNAT family N-acetyltransferase [Chloroflexi bacterium]|nr:GNAT family N-acetyltransferase [Chloroflexota bacterium]